MPPRDYGAPIRRPVKLRSEPTIPDEEGPVSVPHFRRSPMDDAPPKPERERRPPVHHVTASDFRRSLDEQDNDLDTQHNTVAKSRRRDFQDDDFPTAGDPKDDGRSSMAEYLHNGHRDP